MKDGLLELGTYSLLGSADDLHGNNGADVPNAVNARVQQVRRTLLGSESLGQGQSGSLDHAVRDGGGASQEGAETDTGEDEHVVALAGFHLLAIVLDGSVRAAGGEEDLAVGPLDGILEVELAHGEGVGEGEDDGALVELGHGFDDFLGEGTLERWGGVSDEDIT